MKLPFAFTILGHRIQWWRPSQHKGFAYSHTTDQPIVMHLISLRWIEVRFWRIPRSNRKAAS